MSWSTGLLRNSTADKPLQSLSNRSNIKSEDKDMRISSLALLVLLPSVCPLRANYTYSIAENYIWGDYSSTPNFSTLIEYCPGKTLDGRSINGICIQTSSQELFTNWGWVDQYGELTSPYPPGPWIEQPAVRLVEKRVLTWNTFTYFDLIDGVVQRVDTGGENLPTMEETVFYHSFHRIRYPQVDPDPPPPPPDEPEPATWLTLISGSALLACRWQMKAHAAS